MNQHESSCAAPHERNAAQTAYGSPMTLRGGNVGTAPRTWRSTPCDTWSGT
jgi:hypothetical protein